MTDQFFYQTITQEGKAEFKDRGSKFIAYAFPIKGVESFKEIMGVVKKEHPSATHHCFAYRIGTKGLQFRSSDDGEPSGTAGKPILGQIDSRGITNVLIIVVRYFGGTQLGVPGLINAYRTAAALSLQMVSIVKKPILVNYRLQFDYTIMNEVMRIIKHHDCEVLEQETALFCKIIAGLPMAKEERILHLFSNTQGLSVEKENTVEV